MAVFSLLGRVGLDARAFNQGLATIRSGATSTASHVTSQLGGSLRGAVAGIVGVAGVGAIIGKYKDVINEAAKIRNQAFEFGFNTDELQTLSYVAEQNGRSIEDLRAVMEKLTEAQRKVIMGNTEMGAAFAQLGIDAESFVKIDKPIDALRVFAGAVGSSESGLASMNAQMLILGGQAQKLGGILRNDFDGTFEAGKAFNIDPETIAGLSVAGDKLTDLDYTMKKIWSDSAPLAFGFLTKLAQAFKVTFGSIGTFFGNLSVSGSISEAWGAAKSDFNSMAADFKAFNDKPGASAQGILDRLNANTGGQAIKDSVLAEMLLAQKQGGGEGGGFSFFKSPGADKFTKHGFSLSGNQNINFNPPVMREQLDELRGVKREVQNLKGVIDKKL